MIFYLITLTQGHQFDHMVKILLAFCSTQYPRQFDMSHDHVRKKIDFLSIPGASQVWYVDTSFGSYMPPSVLGSL